MQAKVPPEYKEALHSIAFHMGGTLSSLIREAVLAYVESHPSVPPERVEELRRLGDQIRPVRRATAIELAAEGRL